MTRKMKAAIGAVVGVFGLVGAAIYRVRYDRDTTISSRRRRLENIIREEASDDAEVYAD